MAQVVEVSGIDVEDAVARALNQLGLSRDQVDVDVVREGKKGFLGFGAEESVVRVTAKPGVLPGSQRPRNDSRFRGGRGGGRGPAPRDRSIRSAHESEEERQRREGAARARLEDGDERQERGGGDRGERPAGGGGGERAPQGATASGSPGESPYRGTAAPGARPERREGGGEGREGARGGRSRGGRGRGRGRDRGPREGGPERGPDRGPREGERAPRPFVASVGGSPSVPGAPEAPPVAPIADAEDELDLGGRTLRDVLSLLGLNETEISAREPETPGDGVGLMTQVFDIVGTNDEASDELGLLIGRRGETLQALQYLVNVIVSSRYDGEQIFAIDVEQYKRRREQSLVEMAHRIANEVRSTGDVITLEPMPPAERRIIHLALQEEEGVVTESVGEGSNRQVEILPAQE